MLFQAFRRVALGDTKANPLAHQFRSNLVVRPRHLSCAVSSDEAGGRIPAEIAADCLKAVVAVVMMTT